MSTCIKLYCNIYRDKIYCRNQSNKKFNLHGECDCLYARKACEVGEYCPQKIFFCGDTLHGGGGGSDA